MTIDNPGEPLPENPTLEKPMHRLSHDASPEGQSFIDTAVLEMQSVG
jgi:hypothetical protein